MIKALQELCSVMVRLPKLIQLLRDDLLDVSRCESRHVLEHAELVPQLVHAMQRVCCIPQMLVGARRPSGGASLQLRVHDLVGVPQHVFPEAIDFAVQGLFRMLVHCLDSDLCQVLFQQVHAFRELVPQTVYLFPSMINLAFILRNLLCEPQVLRSEGCRCCPQLLQQTCGRVCNPVAGLKHKLFDLCDLVLDAQVPLHVFLKLSHTALDVVEAKIHVTICRRQSIHSCHCPIHATQISIGMHL
mmetsp:Transcript_72264/g.136500  ORF Transcript_72264/g.136500 Transcript_72264/m.136500 type:complete len:244 (-) Transcript_72264:38-769(-)